MARPHVARADVSRDRLQDGGGSPHQERDAERASVEGVGRIAKQEECVNPGHGEAGGSVRRERHVQRLREGGRAHHRRDRINIHWLPVHDVEPDGRVHPRSQ